MRGTEMSETNILTNILTAMQLIKSPKCMELNHTRCVVLITHGLNQYNDCNILFSEVPVIVKYFCWRVYVPAVKYSLDLASLRNLNINQRKYFNSVV